MEEFISCAHRRFQNDLLFHILAFIHDTKDSLTAQQLVQKQTNKQTLPWNKAFALGVQTVWIE